MVSSSFPIKSKLFKLVYYLFFGFQDANNPTMFCSLFCDYMYCYWVMDLNETKVALNSSYLMSDRVFNW